MDDNGRSRHFETHNWDSIVKTYIAEYMVAISVFNALEKSTGK